MADPDCDFLTGAEEMMTSFHLGTHDNVLTCDTHKHGPHQHDSHGVLTLGSYFPVSDNTFCHCCQFMQGIRPAYEQNSVSLTGCPVIRHRYAECQPRSYKSKFKTQRIRSKTSPLPLCHFLSLSAFKTSVFTYVACKFRKAAVSSVCQGNTGSSLECQEKSGSSSVCQEKSWSSSVCQEKCESSSESQDKTGSGPVYQEKTGSNSFTGTRLMSKIPSHRTNEHTAIPGASINATTASTFPSALRVILLFLLVFLSSAPLPSHSKKVKVSLHAIIPRHFAMTSELTREFRSTVLNFRRDIRTRRFRDMYITEEDLTFINDDTPKEILDAFCDGILAKHAVTILNINNPLGIRRRASSNQYILELAEYLGIPVISWDTQFGGASQLASVHRTLQLAPTIEHQALAMVSLLERYNWTTFSIVTSQVAGDADFVIALENQVESSKKRSMRASGGVRKESLEILSHIHIPDLQSVRSELSKLVGSDTRVFLLHCSSRASYDIIETAVKLGLTGKDYVWILTRSSIPTGKYGLDSFPVGLMGISFEYELEAMKRVIRAGVKTWLFALKDMAEYPAIFSNITMPPEFTCDSEDNVFWKDGNVLYNYMLNVSIWDEPQIQFNENGTLKHTDVIIINLQWYDGRKEKTVWNEVGRWNRHGLVMEDITWPGESSVPPSGKPKRAFLRVATLNEQPYVIYNKPEPDGSCGEKALPCYIYIRNEEKEIISNGTVFRCCVGLSMDLLKILSERLNFDVEIKEVEDGKWGGINKATKEWNGLVKALLEDQADIVMTSFKINPERASAVRFSTPYLETGIKIIVALRDGAISPTAFLEPFDFFSWILIVLLSVHVMAAIIFIFEWAVPSYGSVRQEHKFSLFRSFWLIWAMLFSTSVQTDTPKGIASRFLANIWALFALVFLASYTANLAAFMITKEEYYDLSGIQDIRLQNPYTMKPPFKYATIPNGSTEANIRANHLEMYNYMKAFNKPDVDAGIAALKSGDIQAFIYDSSVLEYYASRDPKCRLVTVGNRYAMTGYGVGFPPDHRNPWIDKINRVILRLQTTGELERLREFWLAGACDKKKEKGVSNRTLGILNFTSAFILLGTGVLLGLLILLFEHLYFMFGRKYLRKWDKCGCCALVSLSMGKSLQLKDYVDEAIHVYTKNRCKDPVCETQIWKLRHQLDMALLKIETLQSQIRAAGSGTLMLLPSPTMEHESSIPHGQNSIALRANGTKRTHTTTVPLESHGSSGTSNGHNKIPKSSVKPALSDVRDSSEESEIPQVTFNGGQSRHAGRGDSNVGRGDRGNVKDNGNLVEKFEQFMDNLEKGDHSPSDQYSDTFLPPPPFGESPLLGDVSGAGSYDTSGGMLGGSHGGETYVGFDDFSSDGGSAPSGSVLAGPGGTTEASPIHALRRTPSYTSAVGGSLNTDLVESPTLTGTGRVRQFDGKKYMGVGNKSPVT